jgi:hypothetical protein
VDIEEFLKQFVGQTNNQPNVTSVGNENLNLNAYTTPNVGGNVNAYQPTPVGLLSGTIGKEGTNPIYKDVALTNENFRGGILSQADNVAPYGEYRDGNVMARVMGGNYPNASANYITPVVVDSLHVTNHNLTFGIAFILGFLGLSGIDFAIKKFMPDMEEQTAPKRRASKRKSTKKKAPGKKKA